VCLSVGGVKCPVGWCHEAVRYLRRSTYRSECEYIRGYVACSFRYPYRISHTRHNSDENNAYIEVWWVLLVLRARFNREPLMKPACYCT
jgi:hypothetical protein